MPLCSYYRHESNYKKCNDVTFHNISGSIGIFAGSTVLAPQRKDSPIIHLPSSKSCTPRSIISKRHFNNLTRIICCRVWCQCRWCYSLFSPYTSRLSYEPTPCRQLCVPSMDKKDSFHHITYNGQFDLIIRQ